MSGLLASVLFAPWFLILCWVYWRFGRANGTSKRFDVAAIVIAMIAGVVFGIVGLDYADTAHGNLWPQILASLLAYGLFLLVLLIAAMWRRKSVANP